jgi:diguanylate cyclase (GGDEF)-like protein/PAS domain S-box-containing protein
VNDDEGVSTPLREFEPVTDIDVFEMAAVGTIVTDRTGCLRRVNPAFARLLGRDREDLIGKSFSSLTSPDDVTLSLGVMQNLLNGTTDVAQFEKRYLRPDGSIVWAELHIRSITDADGAVLEFLVQVVDITDRKLTEQALERLHWQLGEAQSIAGLGSFEMDPTGAIHPSDELCRILGRSTLEDIPSLMQVVHPDDRDAVATTIRACLEERTSVDATSRLLRAEGDVRWVRVRADWSIGDDGRDALVGTVLDITDRKLAEKALKYQGFHDLLTGLANRTLFLDRVEHALKERAPAPVAVLFLDLDDFKTVNDNLGHPAGDQLLIEVTRRLASIARVGDTVARIGGDEFAFLLEYGVMPQTAEDVARRIADVLRPPVHLGDSEVVVSASIGVATGQPLHDTAAAVLRNADLAMYLAKRNGKARFELFRPGMEDESLKRFAITADLRHALDNDELEVFYQPVVDSHDATPVGAEALIRWHHPRRGLVNPVDFIDVAESTGLIVPLGDWILNEACRQVEAWRHAGVVDDGFYISVNLSARQLAEPNLVENVDRALGDSGLPPDVLVLEVTESTLMLDFDAGLARLQALKALGLRIALDDYGTGYSSLSRLRELPVDIIKIDKSFIDQLGVDQQGAALVKSVVDVTRALGIHSIAEGVERESQRAILDEMECDHIQGFLFAKPESPADAARTLQRLRVQRSHTAKSRHQQKGTGRPSIDGPLAT